MINPVTAGRVYIDVAAAYGLSRVDAKALVLAALYGDRTAHLLMEAALVVGAAARGEL